MFIIAAILAILLKKPDITDLDEDERLHNGAGGEDEEIDVDRPRTGNIIDQDKSKSIKTNNFLIYLLY